MKRMLTAALALLLALSLCACGAQDTDDTPTYPAAFSGLETLIDTAREEGRLTVCGTGDEAYMTALCEKFEELFDIKTTYRAITAAQAAAPGATYGSAAARIPAAPWPLTASC